MDLQQERTLRANLLKHNKTQFRLHNSELQTHRLRGPCDVSDEVGGHSAGCTRAF